MGEEYGYRTAMICTGGHVITSDLEQERARGSKKCSQCGSETIIECLHCGKPIRGELRGRGRLPMGLREPPKYCHDCGEPYPWTADAIDAAEELADEIEGLTPDDRDRLKQIIPDLVRDTPKTEIASLRYQKIMSKADADANGIMKSILIGVATEAAKRLIWSDG